MKREINGYTFEPPRFSDVQICKWEIENPAVGAYLRKAVGGEAKHPEQHLFICHYPFYELKSDIAAKYNLYDRLTIPKPGLFAFGKTRQGKDTSFAMSAASDYSATPDVPEDGVLSFLASELQAALSDIKTAAKTTEACKVAGLLILEDFGDGRWYAERDSEPRAAMLHLWSVIHYRHKHDLPMYISSNVMGADLWERFHPDFREKLKARINEACYVINFDDPEWSFEAEFRELQEVLQMKAALQAKREADEMANSPA